jgi:hypothetical protein
MGVHVRIPLDLPEYDIEVRNGEEGESFVVGVVQRASDTCKVLVDTIVSPFMVQGGVSGIMETSTAMLAEVKELIQNGEYYHFRWCGKVSRHGTGSTITRITLWIKIFLP